LLMVGLLGFAADVGHDEDDGASPCCRRAVAAAPYKGDFLVRRQLHDRGAGQRRRRTREEIAVKDTASTLPAPTGRTLTLQITGMTRASCVWRIAKNHRLPRRPSPRARVPSSSCLLEAGRVGTTPAGPAAAQQGAPVTARGVTAS
jgi:hypothetical protein